MEQSAFAFDVPEPVDTFSVGQLNQRVRDALRRAFPDEVWVRGEVQNLKRSAAGHTYFSLVEKAGRGDRVVAQLDVVLFRDDRRAVERAMAAVPGAELGDDVEVRIRGRATLYPGTGRYQLVMSDIDPVFTVGGIAANRERALRALADDGLVEENATRRLAEVPLRVGLVTSVGSAAYHDFVHELASSGYAWEVAVADVRVQGSAAARRIKWALGALARLPLDVVVLTRGGGARADLAPFDTELVARAVATMPVPVVAGIGHETDRSVTDVVAHTTCKTPTACAQLLVQRVGGFVDALDAVAVRIGAAARRSVALAGRDLDDAARRARREAPIALAREQARIELRVHRLGELGRRHTTDAARIVADRERSVGTAATRHLRQADTRLSAMATAVRAFDPQRVLERGYSVTRDPTGAVLRDSHAVAPGAVLTTQLARGRVTSVVENVAREVTSDEETA